MATKMSRAADVLRKVLFMSMTLSLKEMANSWGPPARLLGGGTVGRGLEAGRYRRNSAESSAIQSYVFEDGQSSAKPRAA